MIRLIETGDPHEAAQFANVVASFSVEGPGVTAIPHRQQVEAYLGKWDDKPLVSRGTCVSVLDLYFSVLLPQFGEARPHPGKQFVIFLPLDLYEKLW